MGEGNLRDLRYGRGAMVYMDDVNIIISEEQLPHIEDDSKRYEMVARAKFNQEKSVVLQLGTWRGKWMSPNSIVRHQTEGLVKLLGVWFRENLQLEKN